VVIGSLSLSGALFYKPREAHSQEPLESPKLDAMMGELLLGTPKKIVIVPGESLAQIEERKEPKILKKPIPTAPRTQNVSYCSCVLFARARSGINVGRIGLAKNHPINSREPKPGSIVVTKESSAGHVAYVTAVTDTEIVIEEANYHRCQKGTRTLSKTSSVIRGYFSP